MLKRKSTSDTQQAILDVQDIKVHFAITQKNAWPWSKPEILKAVDGIRFRFTQEKL
ncbi:hypothetical protein [Saccharobesus litoralis]|uniref:hypothetical protein n=1 Tax=Saccharobesus litoralis TaxID=2172099 RepID=UPI001E401899|nr:hypothetical protein [Saccharobesus litoralis]